MKIGVDIVFWKNCLNCLYRCQSSKLIACSKKKVLSEHCKSRSGMEEYMDLFAK